MRRLRCWPASPIRACANRFGDLVLHGDDAFKGVKAVAKSDGMIDGVVGDANAIGYVALHNVKGGVKALRMDEVEMNRLTVLSDRYPLARSFYLAVYRTPTPTVSRISCSLAGWGPEGQRLLSESGLLPVHAASH